MNDGRLGFVEISSKTKMLTMTDGERFQRKATRVKMSEKTGHELLSNAN